MGVEAQVHLSGIGEALGLIHTSRKKKGIFLDIYEILYEWCLPIFSMVK
jgi:hypothetical protein